MTISRRQILSTWATVINRNGGATTVVHLPEQGVRGNTHLFFSDLNKRQSGRSPL